MPGILMGMQSPATCEYRPLNVRYGSGFRYDVKRGSEQISIFVILEDEMTVCEIDTESPSPIGWRGSGELLKDATEALLHAGMKEITVEELEELEARRSREDEKHPS